MKPHTHSLSHHHNLTTPFSTSLPIKRSNAPCTVRMSLREDGRSVAIAGVTGAVGQEFLSLFSDPDFPYRSLKLLASEAKTLTYTNCDSTVEELRANSFEGVDFALFSSGGSISNKFEPISVEKGAFVVDNSSAFRMDEGLSPVITEVNPEGMDGIKLNQRCSEIFCLHAATPLHPRGEITRMVVSTYQAASDAGVSAMEELELQTREVLEGKEPTCKIFPFSAMEELELQTREVLEGKEPTCKIFTQQVQEGKESTCKIFKQQYAFNLFSDHAPILSNGYSEEEMKLVSEARKIWNDKDVKVTATCISVPVIRAHAESVNLQSESPLDEDIAREILRESPHVVVIDGDDDVVVGTKQKKCPKTGTWGSRFLDEATKCARSLLSLPFKFWRWFGNVLHYYIP